MVTAVTAMAHEPTIVSFDPPGSTLTYGFAINSAGVIAGAYLDTSDVYHAYLRAPDGSFTIFDAPGAGTGSHQGTAFYAITAEGTLAGQYIDSNNVFHPFLREPIPSAITSGILLRDNYIDASNVIHGFVRTP